MKLTICHHFLHFLHHILGPLGALEALVNLGHPVRKYQQKVTGIHQTI